MSIAGGLPNALRRGVAAGCGVVQLFLKNQLRWSGGPSTRTRLREFRRELDGLRARAACAHANYLVNLATPDPGEWTRAVDALTDELERAERLELPFVVLASGLPSGRGVHRRLGRASSARWTRSPHGRRERESGSPSRTRRAPGTSWAPGPRNWARIFGRVSRPERLALCLDTCHLFAAGYDIRDAAAASRPCWTCSTAIVGLERLVAFHLNDCRAGLGSRLDRHENIGAGQHRPPGLPLPPDAPPAGRPAHDPRDAQARRRRRAEPRDPSTAAPGPRGDPGRPSTARPSRRPRPRARLRPARSRRARRVLQHREPDRTRPVRRDRRRRSRRGSGAAGCSTGARGGARRASLLAGARRPGRRLRRGGQGRGAGLLQAAGVPYVVSAGPGPARSPTARSTRCSTAASSSTWTTRPPRSGAPPRPASRAAASSPTTSRTATRTRSGSAGGSAASTTSGRTPRREAMALFEQAGFRVESCRPFHVLPRNVWGRLSPRVPVPRVARRRPYEAVDAALARVPGSPPPGHGLGPGRRATTGRAEVTGRRCLGLCRSAARGSLGAAPRRCRRPARRRPRRRRPTAGPSRSRSTRAPSAGDGRPSARRRVPILYASMSWSCAACTRNADARAADVLELGEIQQQHGGPRRGRPGAAPQPLSRASAWSRCRGVPSSQTRQRARAPAPATSSKVPRVWRHVLDSTPAAAAAGVQPGPWLGRPVRARRGGSARPSARVASRYAGRAPRSARSRCPRATRSSRHEHPRGIDGQGRLPRRVVGRAPGPRDDGGRPDAPCGRRSRDRPPG